jgi:hypothetical protein
MLEQVLPYWLDMERTLEAYKIKRLSMLLGAFSVDQTRSYEQAVEASSRSRTIRSRSLAARYVESDGTA